MKKTIILFLILLTLTVQAADERYIAEYDTRTFPTPADTTSTITTTDTSLRTILSLPWADANIADNITVNWTGLDTYPGACDAGEYVSTIGDTLTCSAPTVSFGAGGFVSIPWADVNVADNITIEYTGITGHPYTPTEADIDLNALAWDTNFTNFIDFNSWYASLFGAIFTGDTNFSNIGFSGYIYGDGSKLTGIGTSTTFYPDSATISGGSDLTNDIDAMIYYDGNSYTFTEASGSNPLDVNIYFSGVDSISQIIIREYYFGSSSHHIEIQLWDYDSDDWESYANIVGQSGYNVLTLGIYDSEHHVDSGDAILRLHHVDNGISSHRLYIDFAWLLKGTSVGASTDLNGYAKYNFQSNNFVGTGNFGTSGDGNFGNIQSTNAFLTNLAVSGDFNVTSIDVSGVSFFDGGVIATGDSNFTNLQASYFFGNGAGITGVVAASGWQPDTTLDVNTTANTSWLGKAHTFTAIQTIQADFNITESGTGNGVSFEPDLNRMWLGHMYLDYNGTGITIGG